MFKYEQDFAKVEKLRAKHPNKSTKELLDMAKVKGAAYYRARKSMKPKAKAPKHKTIAAPIEVAQPADPRLIFLMGSPEQIRAVLAGGAL